MSGLSDYLENKLVDHTLGTTSYTVPSNVYVALFLTDPGDSGSGTEVSGNGYSRQLVTFGASSGGSASNSTQETFTASGGSFGTVTHFGIYDASTSGNLLYHGSLASSKLVGDGESLVFAIGALTVTLS